jgi:hypothetical protein
VPEKKGNAKSAKEKPTEASQNFGVFAQFMVQDKTN